MPPRPDYKNMLVLSGETDAIMHEWEPSAAVADVTLPIPTDMMVRNKLGESAIDPNNIGGTDIWHHQARGDNRLTSEEVSNGYRSRLKVYERLGEYTFRTHRVNQNNGVVKRSGEGPDYSMRVRDGVYVVKKHGLLAEVQCRGKSEEGNTVWDTLITSEDNGSRSTREVVSPEGRLLSSSSFIVRGDYRYTESRKFAYDDGGKLISEHRSFEASNKSVTKFNPFEETLTYEYDNNKVVITGKLSDGTVSRKITRTYVNGALKLSDETVLVDVFPFEKAGTNRKIVAEYDYGVMHRPISPSEMAYN